MTFQKQVRQRQGFGFVGDIRLESPWRASAFILTDGDRDPSEAPNVNIVGRACTYADSVLDGEEYQYATVGGTGAFCGVICNSKQYVSRSALSVPIVNGEYDKNGIENLLYVPSGSIVELVTMGHIVLQITNSALPGDYLCFSQETGEIMSESHVGDTEPTAPEGYTLLKNARVDRYPQTNKNGGLILARFTY